MGSRGPRATGGLLLVSVLSFSLTAAQELATLQGRVTDPEGRPIAGAVVSVRRAGSPTGGVPGALTNARGEYRIAGLPPAPDYEITCSFPGHATVIARPVRLIPGSHLSLDFMLPREIIETVRIVERGTVIEPDTTTTSTSVGRELLAGLPILGRNYSDVLVLAPGVTDTDGDGNPNVKGAREVDFQLRISNVQVNNPFSGGRALDFNIEAIEEIQILTGALTAEHSSQGGVGAVTTRSGSNDFEGSFKLFYQSRSIDGDGANNNDITDSRVRPSSFRAFRPFLTAGGAFARDRLWYFTALEYIDEQEPTVFGPATLNSSLEGYRNFAKLSLQLNPAHRAALEIHYEPTDTAGNNIGPTISEDSDVLVDSIGRLLSLRETSLFSPTLLLDSTLSLFSLDYELYPVSEPHPSIEDDIELYSSDLARDPVMLNFVLRNQFSVFPVTENYSFDPNSGTVRGPYWITQSQESRQFALREDLSFYTDDWFGSHTIKVGAELLAQRYDEQVEFRPTVSRIPVRPAGWLHLIDAPLPVGTVPLEAERGNFAFYVQDSWRPLPNLTLTLGARLDREVVFSQGRAMFEPAAEVEEYNRLARLYYSDPSPAGDVPGATGRIVLGSEPNFRINPHTDTFYCDLDADGTCNGFTSPVGAPLPGVPTNSDQMLLRRSLSRHGLDCALNPIWTSEPGPVTGLGRACIGRENTQGLREGRDLRQEEISLGNMNVAPRFSLSYDPFSDGKSKLYATYGRFYGWLFLESVAREGQASFQSFSLLQPDLGQLFLHEPHEGGFSIYQISRDLRTPFTDEITLGLERELAPELALKAIFTQRKGRNQLQDVDVNHETVDRRTAFGDGSDGLPDDCLDASQTSTKNCDPDGILDLETLNPHFNQIFRVGNFNSSTYRSLELVLNKRLHNNWQFEASYTWSEAEGSAESFSSFLGDDPSQVEIEEGFLSYDQRHVFKFNAVAHRAGNFNVGGTIQYESGLPFSIVKTTVTRDNLGNRTFRTTFPTGQRNDQRNKALWTFNLNLKKAFTLGGRVQAVASFDVFDLLNTDDLRIHRLDLTESQGLQVSGPIDPATRQYGRRFQLGIEMHF